MTILRLGSTTHQAWTLWRSARAVLWPLTGLFLFVPQYAVLLLVPDAPRMEGEGAVAAANWAPAFEAWMSANAPLYLVAALLVQFGTLGTTAVLLAPRGATVGQGLARAGTLFFRYMLAVVLVTLPLAVPMVAILRAPLLMPFAMAALFYILARTATVGPVLVAERGTGAVQAIVRSWRLTQGNGVRLGAMIGAALLAGSILGSAVSGIDGVLRAGGVVNPVMTAIIGAVASAATWASTLAIALIEVAAYRRLASSGT